MTAVLFLTFALYLAVPGFLLFLGWPLRAGLGMLFVAILPMFWQMIYYPESDAPGSGMLFILPLPLPLLLIFAGLVAYTIWLSGWLRGRRTSTKP